MCVRYIVDETGKADLILIMESRGKYWNSKISSHYCHSREEEARRSSHFEGLQRH